MKIGSMILFNDKYFCILEEFAEHYKVLEVNLEDEEFQQVEGQDFLVINKDAKFDIVSNMKKDALEKIKRAEIFDKISEFYGFFHKKEGKNFLNYAGKIYDEKEMIALTDASLDFWLTSGRYCTEFEKKLAKYLGVRFALLTNSGSSANLLALSALTSPKLGDRRIQRGDEVITVAAGFPTTIAPIVQNGLIPVFLDIDLGTYNIKTDLLEEAISEKTKVIMIAHTMGNPFDLGKIMEVAKKYNLWVIEDNCDALGAKYNGKLTGTHGHIGTSSFYPPHHITMGEGGAVYTNDPKLKVIIESFRDWGRDCWCSSGCDDTCKKRFGWQLGDLPQGYDHKYTYSHLGYNLKVTDMQAAIGVEQLNKLPNFIELRNRNFNLLKEKLKVIEDYVILPEANDNSEPSWFGFIITLKDNAKVSRNELVRYLEDNKIQTRMLFAGNITKQPAFEGVEYRVVGDLMNSDKIMNDTFLVGVYPGLDEKDITYIADKIISVFKFME